ncbi:MULTISPECIES: MBL fold metallo-hydrolase [unclassified Lysobacter]|uniref:MBL fold metallo-hydrolase n=1 Tax=unclassified Lysobacter TaxID=2635362 RepID=UPI0007014099|nr:MULTISPECIES: MBL fold metallo-hydrolase [unclassified Lysobacter]KQZ63596.1 MBL fold metallo-hydrolase [Lysobacter sp. Root559]KRC36481.1 MBL fold metallo-hydrolase [Lysobacter sp. Root76]KRD64811.1 MBL fold metallo-hydrolase [Lysobacter sp. Root96]
MTRTHLSLLIAASLAGAMLAGCSKPQPAASDTPAPVAAAPATAPQAAAPQAANPDVLRFKIGTLDAAALKDGDIDAPNDGKTFAIGQPAEAVNALLSAAGQPTDMLHLSIQPLLVRSGDRVLLFDTGAADASFARAGRLPASLRAAGVEPSQVTDIFLSHQHPDHTGGLLTKEGKLAFPNASIHLSAPEWESLKKDRDSAKLVAAMTPKVATFQPGAAIVPGVVTAVAVDGHTPGHSAYEIASGDQRLLYIGDTAHHFVISVQRPEWTVQYDMNAPLAQASRRALLQRAADGNLRLYAVHFPFPGLGHVKAQGEGFVWVPEN